MGSLYWAAYRTPMMSHFTCVETHIALSAYPSSTWSGFFEFTPLMPLFTLSTGQPQLVWLFSVFLRHVMSSFPEALNLAVVLAWSPLSLIFTQLADFCFLHLFGKASLTIHLTSHLNMLYKPTLFYFFKLHLSLCGICLYVFIICLYMPEDV